MPQELPSPLGASFSPYQNATSQVSTSIFICSPRQSQIQDQMLLFDSDMFSLSLSRGDCNHHFLWPRDPKQQEARESEVDTSLDPSRNPVEMISRNPGPATRILDSRDLRSEIIIENSARALRLYLTLSPAEDISRQESHRVDCLDLKWETEYHPYCLSHPVWKRVPKNSII